MSDERVSALTTDQLLFSAPPGIRMWGAEKLINGEWCRQQWTPPHGDPLHTRTRAPYHFPMAELTVDTIRARFGPGRFRLVWSNGPGKRRKGTTQPFLVPKLSASERADQKASAEEHADPHGPVLPRGALPVTPIAGPPPPPRPSSPYSSNGNGAHSSLRGLPTSETQLPPLVATDAPRYMAARAGDPMQLFLSMWALVQQEMARREASDDRRSRERSEAEDRRHREHVQLVELRLRQFELDAQVRVAEAQARSQADRDHAEQLRAELDHARELTHQAQLAASEGRDDELGQLLAQIVERLDTAGDDDEDELDADHPVMAQIINAFGPTLAQTFQQWAAAKIAGAGATVTDAVDDGAQDALDAIDAQIDD